MLAIGSRALGDRTRRAIAVEGDVFQKSEWMDTGKDPVLSPTVALIEQPPNITLLSHFHRENQFQVSHRSHLSAGLLSFFMQTPQCPSITCPSCCNMRALIRTS